MGPELTPVALFYQKEKEEEEEEEWLSVAYT